MRARKLVRVNPPISCRLREMTLTPSLLAAIFVFDLFVFTHKVVD